MFIAVESPIKQKPRSGEMFIQINKLNTKPRTVGAGSNLIRIPMLVGQMGYGILNYLDHTNCRKNICCAGCGKIQLDSIVAMSHYLF